MPLAVQFTQVSRTFGEVKAVDQVSIDIEDGEFFSMLGPSGSGKTTCLRLIAGFEQPSSGSIRIHGSEAAGLPPYQRDVNTVFQDYALFPHMNVRDNVAYGLKVKGVAKAERHAAPKKPWPWSPWRLRRAQAGAALRRPAPARGPGPRPGQPAARAAARRTAGRLDLKLREQMQAS
jgi:putative spermidine/putrescine transport system ATP-binding protein